jgi:hypothetical protein
MIGMFVSVLAVRTIPAPKYSSMEAHPAIRTGRDLRASHQPTVSWAPDAQLEIMEEGGPVRFEAMHLEIAQREGQALVDADQHRHVLSQPLG